MMLLMLRSLKKTILLSSLLVLSLCAETNKELVQDFIDEQLKNNPFVVEGKAKITEVKPIEQLKGWDAYIIKLHVKLKNNQEATQKVVLFSNGELVANDFIDILTGDSIKDSIKPKFDDEYYQDKYLIYGSKNAKHKVAIFSDPLCPFCKQYVPQILEYTKKDPNKFAVYYYNLPLQRLHPASVDIVKALIAARLKGIKIDKIKLYKEFDIKPNEKDPKKILDKFNRVMGTNLSVADIRTKAVEDEYKKELKISDDLMVAGTPSVYIDGKYDRTKKLYKKVK